jgi:hypothetical protein
MTADTMTGVGAVFALAADSAAMQKISEVRSVFMVACRRAVFPPSRLYLRQIKKNSIDRLIRQTACQTACGAQVGGWNEKSRLIAPALEDCTPGKLRRPSHPPGRLSHQKKENKATGETGHMELHGRTAVKPPSRVKEGVHSGFK